MSSTATSGTFELAANTAKDFSVIANPNGTAGTAKVELRLEQDSKTLLTIPYEITAAVQAPNFSMAKNTDSGSSFANNDKVEYTTNITNDSGADLELKWVKEYDAQTPSAWNIDVCDNNLCYPANVFSQTFNMPASSSFDLKVGFNPQFTAGTATTTVHVFEPSDSAGTVQTFVVTHTSS